MGRRPTPQLAWEEDEEGESAGPYTIRLEGERRWQLTAQSRSAGIYPTRTAARKAAVRLQRRHRLTRRFIVAAAIAGVSLVALGATLTRRSEPNPEYPPARAFADRIDEAQLSVAAGEVDIEEVDQTFEGIAGGAFEHRGRTKLGLTGVLDGDCYGMVWQSGQPVSGVVRRSEYQTCQPDPSLIDQPVGLGGTPTPLWPDWKYTLPDPERSPVWFIPLVSVSFGFLLAATLRTIGLAFLIWRRG